MSVSDALRDEIEALTSIYDSEVLRLVDGRGIFSLPNTAYSFSLSFPSTYPDEPPCLIGTHHVDASAKKGEGDTAADLVRDILGRVYTPGQVCLFDVVEEATPLLLLHHEAHDGSAQDTEDHGSQRSASPRRVFSNDSLESSLTWFTTTTTASSAVSSIPEPKWVLSEPLTVNKSTFIGRCVGVKSLAEARDSISHLLSTNKRVAGATHNITAWRVKNVSSQPGASEIVIQDSDDDGETAAGGRLLHLMQLMDVWNVVVVVTRFYGGVKLGPDRFRCINAAAREALVNGGFAKIEKSKDGKSSGKKGKK